MKSQCFYIIRHAESETNVKLDNPHFTERDSAQLDPDPILSQKGKFLIKFWIWKYSKRGIFKHFMYIM